VDAADAPAGPEEAGKEMSATPPRQAGELDKLMQLQTPTTVQNTTGEEIEGWADGSLVWAKREPLTGNEAIAAQTVVADAAYRVWVRYRSGVDATMRGVFSDGLILNFGAVLRHGRSQWLER
jgi:SPP1 family predicted phage head-tail adaptor